MKSNIEEKLMTINAIRNSLLKHEQYEKDLRCDKMGFGVNLDNRFSSFSTQINLCAWRGYHGNSSCSSFLNIGNKEIFTDAFCRVLSNNLKTLLYQTADLIEIESKKEKLKYLNQLKKQISEIEAIDNK